MRSFLRWRDVLAEAQLTPFLEVCRKCQSRCQESRWNGRMLEMREWSIITINSNPSNPQQPIHSLRDSRTSKKIGFWWSFQHAPVTISADFFISSLRVIGHWPSRPSGDHPEETKNFRCLSDRTDGNRWDENRMSNLFDVSQKCCSSNILRGVCCYGRCSFFYLFFLSQT